MIVAGLQALKCFYYESFCGKTINKIGKWITEYWKKSLIGSWLLNDTADDTLSTSATYRLLTKPFERVYKIGEKLGSSVENSFLCSLAKMQIANAITLDSRFYGLMLLIFAIGLLGLNPSLGMTAIVCAVMAIVGGLLVWINKPLVGYIKHSFIFKFAQWVLGDDFDIEFVESQKGGYSILLGILNGLIMVGASVIHPILAPVAIVGITAMLVVLWRYEAGLYALVFIAPIFPTIVCIGLAAYVFMAYILDRLVNQKPLFKFDGVSFMILLFVLVQLFYSVTSYSVKKSVEIWLVYLMFIAMYFVTSTAVDSKRKLHWFVSLFLTSSLLVSAFGIFQYFFGDNIGHAWLDEEMFEDISVRVYSTLGNPNVLGEYLILAIPLALAMIWSCKGWLSRLYYTGVLGAASLCLVFTQSRGCWIGIIVGIGIYIFIVNKRYIAFLFAGAVVAPFIMPQSIIERFTSIGDTSDSSTSYRVNIWYGVFKLLADFWFVGIGIGERAFARIYPFYAYSNIYAPHSHNIYLQLIVEMGIVGLLVMFFIMLLFWRRLIADFAKKKTAQTVIAVAILSGTIAFMCQGAFDYVWYNYRVVLIFWMLMGLGSATSRIANGREERALID
ncbi:MAG: O-antigen ligase family protein [Eubacteriales bacterium]|nr:O-antigen ligase family protein [Eubacteriales bacterium]